MEPWEVLTHADHEHAWLMVAAWQQRLDEAIALTDSLGLSLGNSTLREAQMGLRAWESKLANCRKQLGMD